MVEELLQVGSPYTTATTCRPIGYLMPEHRFRVWTFSVDSAHTAAREVSDALVRYGLPFMKSLADLRGLCASFEDRSVGIEQVLVYRRPVAWLLAGDATRADLELQKELAVLGDRIDPAAENLKRFAAAFRERAQLKR